MEGSYQSNHDTDTSQRSTSSCKHSHWRCSHVHEKSHMFTCSWNNLPLPEKIKTYSLNFWTNLCPSTPTLSHFISAFVVDTWHFGSVKHRGKRIHVIVLEPRGSDLRTVLTCHARGFWEESQASFWSRLTEICICSIQYYPLECWVKYIQKYMFWIQILICARLILSGGNRVPKSDVKATVPGS